MEPDSGTVRTGTELRIATIMTGGISLAVWMGGVAAEMLRLADPQGAYADLLRRRGYERVRIDVISGTSAGGLNGTFLAAARAWGIDAVQFTDDLRATWLDDGDFEALLRDPRDRDPPSLLQGDGFFTERIEALLDRWRGRVADGAGSRDVSVDPGEPTTKLTLTTTLLQPNVEVFVTPQGPLREADHRGTLSFDTFDLLDDRAPARLARAARSSASYPAAFEPSLIRVGTRAQDDLGRAANHDASRYVIDGGVLVNRPFRSALDAIFGQRALGPVERVLLYVVPRLRTAGPEDHSEVEAPQLATVLTQTAGLATSQSIVDDLHALEEHNRRWRQQRDDRLGWVSSLLPEQRNHLAEQLWSEFTARRAQGSAAATLGGVARRNPALDLETNWRSIVAGVELGRRRADWHRSSFAETLPSAADPFWRWGVTAVEYCFQVVLDLVRSTVPADVLSPTERGETAVELASLRGQLHDTLERVRAFQELDRIYWDLAFTEAPPVETDEAGWASWAEQRYGRWPDVEVPNVEVVDTPDVREAARACVGVILGRDGPVSERFTQVAAQRALMWTALQVATVAERWLRLLDLGRIVEVDDTDDQDTRAGGEVALGAALFRPGSLSAISDVLRHEARGGGDGVDGDGEPGGDGGGDDQARFAVVHALLTLWVIQATTQPDGIEREQPIQLIALSSDGAVAVDPRERSSPTQKLTGTQLSHFGAFAKRSWRANDFLWGRLDAAQRIIGWLDGLEPAAASDGSVADGDDPGGFVRRRQLDILDEELPHVARAVREARDAGAAQGPMATDFLDAMEASSDGPSSELLGRCRIGEERLEDEIGSNAFVRTAVSASAVGAQVLAGTNSGLPWLRGPARKARWVALRAHGVVRRTHRGAGRGLFRRIGSAVSWPFRVLVRSARR